MKNILLDLGRMYSLISRVPDALGTLKQLLEEHIYSQGLDAIDKCGETALNVGIRSMVFYLFYEKVNF